MTESTQDISLALMCVSIGIIAIACIVIFAAGWWKLLSVLVWLVLAGIRINPSKKE